MSVPTSPWTPLIKATGSLRTTQGVDVTTEAAGMVRDIYFTPGGFVQKGALLVKLDLDPAVAELHSLEAKAAFAEITFKRNQKQFVVGAVSQETLDGDEANFKSFVAQVEEQKATIALKTIRAPFAGRLGISAINLGQYINPGEKIVALQSLDPIYVDFNLPQQAFPRMVVGQAVNVVVDAYEKETFTGKITTI